MRYSYLLAIFLIASCGGGSGDSNEYSYYQKRDIEPKKLDVSWALPCGSPAEPPSPIDIYKLSSGPKAICPPL